MRSSWHTLVPPLGLAAVDLKAQLQIQLPGGCLPPGNRQGDLFEIWLHAGPAQEFLHQRSSEAARV